MFCPRCGAQINPKQRYCMKCGALNYDHPDNQKMKQYITEEEFNKANEEYNNPEKNAVETVEIGGRTYETKTANKQKYVDTRAALGLLLFITICLGAVYYFVFPYSILMTLALCLAFFLLSFWMLVNICIYMKGGYSGFVSFIPFYSQYALYDIAVGNGWMFLVSFIPIFGLIYALYVSYQIGKVFGKSGLLTLFFPFIMLPIIAFSDSAAYQGDGRKFKMFLEKNKRRNTLAPAFVISALIFLVFLEFTQTSFAEDCADYFTTKDILSVKNKVSKDIEDGVYSCDKGDIVTISGTYYIPFDDATELMDLPIPIRSSFNGNKFSGYFKVVVKGSHNTITYAITDGEDVYSNIYFGLEPEDVIVPKNVNTCKKS